MMVVALPELKAKSVFVDGALAGENVSFSLYLGCIKNMTKAKVVSVENASVDRVEAKCQHFGVCGGCSLMHMSPEAQLSLKQGHPKGTTFAFWSAYS